MSVSVAATALGARLIEKHFILDRSMGGPDSVFSMEPLEFAEMVKSIREVEKALGKIDYELSEKVSKSREFSRSLFVAEDIKQGEVINEINVRSVRPGFGLHPRYYDQIQGKRATRDLKKGTPLQWSMVDS